MNLSKLLLTILFILTFMACDEEEDISDVTPDEPTLNELREESIDFLTSGSSKTWRINQATLTNGDVSFDISQNFNVVDDEFLFEGTEENGIIEWRKGYEVQAEALSSSETLLDKYVSAVSSSFQFQENSSTIVEVDFSNLQENSRTLSEANFDAAIFEINEDNTISALLEYDGNTKLELELVEKIQQDYASVPVTGLDFSPAFTFESNSIGCCAPGMIGSYSSNSIYIVTRESGLNQGNGAPERIVKFDVENNTVSENLFYQQDFSSKQLHVLGDKLISVTGQFINQYNLDLSGEPLSTNHGKRFTRFGTAVLDNNVFIIGGDMDEVENKVFKWNLNTQSLSEFATLPDPKSGARGTIVNDFMYVFGGSETFYGENSSNSIYKISMSDPSQVETYQMDKSVDFTYVKKVQNLIYVAGQKIVRDENGDRSGDEFIVGVFNTTDDTYQNLPTNLTSDSGYDTIHQMCILNGKMYILFGLNGRDNGGQFFEWDVLVASLN